MHLLGNQFAQYLYGEVFLFHPRHLCKEFRVEERKLFLYIRKEVDDLVAFDTLFQQFVDAPVYLPQRYFAPSFHPRKQGAHRLHICRQHALLARWKTLAKRQCLMQEQRFVYETLFLLLSRRCLQVVHTAADSLRTLQIRAGEERHIIVAVEDVAANLQLTLELGICRFGDVGITIVLPVAAGVVVHRTFESGSDAHIIHYQSTLLVAKDAVHPRNSLHKVVPRHRLEDIHRRERRHIEAREPHVHHDSNLERTAVVLEPPFQLAFVRLVAYHLAPFLRVLVSRGHHHRYFLSPCGAHLQDTAVYLHCYRPRICHNHGFAGLLILPIVLIVTDDVGYQRVDGFVRSEQRIDTSQLAFAFLYSILFRLVCHGIVFGINATEHRLVQVEVYHAALVEDRTSGTVTHRLRHVVDIDIVAKDLACRAVAL